MSCNRCARQSSAVLAGAGVAPAQVEAAFGSSAARQCPRCGKWMSGGGVCSHCVMEFDDVFPDPDDVGQSEYLAIYEVVEAFRDDPEMVSGILDEFGWWAQDLRKRWGER